VAVIRNRKIGFTLIEVIIASIVFMIIFSGVAGILKSSLVMSGLSTGTADCIQHFYDGMRLLAEGDNAPPTQSPQPGLLQATRVQIQPNGRLRYWAGTPLTRYDVWINNSQLVRRRFPYVAALPQKVLMGDTNNKIRLFPDTDAANQVATINTGPSATSPCSLVRFSFQIHHDFNGDGVVNSEEMVTTFTTSIFIRNTGY